MIQTCSPRPHSTIQTPCSCSPNGTNRGVARHQVYFVWACVETVLLSLPAIPWAEPSAACCAAGDASPSAARRSTGRGESLRCTGGCPNSAELGMAMLLRCHMQKYMIPAITLATTKVYTAMKRRTAQSSLSGAFVDALQCISKFIFPRMRSSRKCIQQECQGTEDMYIYKYTKHQKYYGPPFHDILNVVRLLESILEPVFRATWRMQSDHFQTNLPQCKRLHVETCSCPCFRQIFHGRRIFCISPALVHWSNTTHSWTLLSHVMTCLLWCCCKHIFCNNSDNGLWCAMHTNYNHSISANLVIVLIEDK